MKRKEIKSFLEMMSYSKGFYGRLLRDINEAENQEAIWEELEAQNFKDGLDIIEYFEC